jgi:protein-tyrosine phosphatase
MPVASSGWSGTIASCVAESVAAARSILFVCSGNICRSPTAEGLVRVHAGRAGLNLVLDSAGTHGFHAGEPPDPRTRAVARARGTPIEELRAREVRSADFHDFELILAADRGHVRQLERRRPRGAGAAVELMLPWCGIDDPDEVPDPYYGPQEGFEAVYELLDRAARRLVERLQGGG